MTIERLRPADAADVADIVRKAAASGEALFVRGGGSKRDYGRPVEAARILDLGRLTGISDYEPAELFLQAQAATPLAEITAILDAHNQMLAFEPPDWSGLLPSDGAPTLGGTIAANIAGPRRVRAGAARDHFLGFSAVDGRGDIWKAGGRVVKNVTGYDMCKLQAGAFGTLSVLLETTVRLLPKPETSCSLVFPGLADQEAIAFLSKALNSPHEVSAAAFLPAPALRRSQVSHALPDASATILRLEGPHPSVAYRAGELESSQAGCVRLEMSDSKVLWREIGAVQPLFGAADSIVWRVCTTPNAAPALLQNVQNLLPLAEGFYDWGGGLLWIEIPADAPEGAAANSLRSALTTGGGHATLLRAEASLRGRIPVFQPVAAQLEALSRRVKSGFDPHGVLNPGRMQQGI
jgi:glycolate oxidase FAD binding subunit